MEHRVSIEFLVLIMLGSITQITWTANIEKSAYQLKGRGIFNSNLGNKFMELIQNQSSLYKDYPTLFNRLGSANSTDSNVFHKFSNMTGTTFSGFKAKWNESKPTLAEILYHKMNQTSSKGLGTFLQSLFSKKNESEESDDSSSDDSSSDDSSSSFSNWMTKLNDTKTSFFEFISNKTSQMSDSSTSSMYDYLTKLNDTKALLAEYFNNKTSQMSDSSTSSMYDYLTKLNDTKALLAEYINNKTSQMSDSSTSTMYDFLTKLNDTKASIIEHFKNKTTKVSNSSSSDDMIDEQSTENENTQTVIDALSSPDEEEITTDFKKSQPVVVASKVLSASALYDRFGELNGPKMLAKNETDILIALLSNSTTATEFKAFEETIKAFKLFQELNNIKNANLFEEVAGNNDILTKNNATHLVEENQNSPKNGMEKPYALFDRDIKDDDYDKLDENDYIIVE